MAKQGLDFLLGIEEEEMGTEEGRGMNRDSFGCMEEEEEWKDAFCLALVRKRDLR